MSEHRILDQGRPGPAERLVDPRKALLLHLPTTGGNRGIAGMRFAMAARAGRGRARGREITPAAVVSEVQRQITRYYSVLDERSRRLLDVITTYPEEARALAEWALEWIEKPQAERDEIMAHHPRLMKRGTTGHLPATDAQLSFARALGHRGPIGTRAEASEIITRLKRERGGAIQ
jgi:hypothetical protein